jgi:toxin CcdB
MARYDVFAWREHPETPYVLDVQTDLLVAFNTRVVLPLIRRTAFSKPISRLHPQFSVRGEVVVMATHLLAAVSVVELSEPVATLEEAHFEIVATLDMLFQGF